MRRACLSDPETARFTSQDDYLGKPDDPPSLHRYFYANDRPTVYIDPTGHIAFMKEAADWLSQTRQDLIESAQDFNDAYERGASATPLPTPLRQVEQYAVRKGIGVGVGVVAGFAGVGAKLVGLANLAANAGAMQAAPLSSYGQEAASETRDMAMGMVADAQAQAKVAIEHPVRTVYEGVLHAAGVPTPRELKQGAASTLAVAKGDPQANASVSAQATEVAVEALAAEGAGRLIESIPVPRRGPLALPPGQEAFAPAAGQWTGRQQFDATKLTDAQVDKAILKSIRRQSGATGTPSGQIAATPDQMESMLKNVTTWRRDVHATDPDYASLRSLDPMQKGTALHSSVQTRMRQLNIEDLAVNERLYGKSPYTSPVTGAPYEYRIPDFRLGGAGGSIFDIKPAGTPLSGPQYNDFSSFGQTKDVRWIYYHPY